MQLLINGLIAGSLGALVAGGLALVYGYLGAFNFALGQFALIGGYITWWLSAQHGLPLFISVPAALLSVGILSLVTFEVAVKPYMRFHRYLPLLTTIAVSMMLDASILLLFGEAPKEIIDTKHPLAIGLTLHWEQVVLVAATVLVIVGISFMLHATRIGRQIRSSVQHQQAAQSLGISSSILTRILFVSSGVLAALGGIFLGVDQVLTPTLGFPITIKAYAAVIAGGRHHFAGPVICAFLIGFLEQFAVGLPWWGGEYISAGYKAVVALCVIILFLLIRPSGLFGPRTRSV